METKENKKEQKVKFSDKHPLFLCIMIIIGFIVIVPGGVWVVEYNRCPYHESYNRPGVKNCIDNYSAKTKNFGDVYIPEIDLCDERIFVTRFENIPGPCPVQYGIWFNGSEKYGEIKTKLVALVQLPPSMPNLTKQEIIDMAKNGELLYGGAVKGTECHNYSWNDLPCETQNKLSQIYRDKDNFKYAWGTISITKIRDIPNSINEETLVSYLEETPYGFKKKEVLVQN